jgi:arabinogalactan endo-1,4-beta-galactosidase
VQTVYNYTRDTFKALVDANAMPDMVQIGNEISNGMLWPDGKLPENWDNLAELLQAGINGVDAGCGNSPRPLIMIHIDKGGDVQATKTFFDKWHTYGIDYDVIGQSYYPWWHGSLLDLRENLIFMANHYEKDIVVVEVAYNCESAEYRDKSAPFPETPEGQRQFLEEVHRLVLNTPHNRGKGVFWWEPATQRGGHRTMFDPNGQAMPVLEVFDKYTRH